MKKKLPRTKKTKPGQTLSHHTPAKGQPTYVTIPENPPKPKQLTFAILNAEEQKVWECSFRDARTRLKYGDLRADGYAWKKVQRQFPRLRKYDGLWGFASDKVVG